MKNNYFKDAAEEMYIFIRIEYKLGGEIIESNLNNWKCALKMAKSFGMYDGVYFNTKASTFINGIKDGFEDEFIKAEVISKIKY